MSSSSKTLGLSCVNGSYKSARSEVILIPLGSSGGGSRPRWLGGGWGDVVGRSPDLRWASLSRQSERPQGLCGGGGC